MSPRSGLSILGGVLIVLSSTPLALNAQGSEWQLVRKGVIRLPTSVSRARTPSLLPDGRLLILDMRAPFIHLLNQEGKSLIAFVGAGEGPGQARNPAGVGYLEGQIWMWDPGNGRMTFFDLGGRVRRELPLRVVGNVLPLGNDRFVTIPNTSFSPGIDSTKRVVLSLVDSTGANRGQFYSFEDRVPSIELRRPGGATSVGGQPYVRNAYKMYYPYGNGVAIAFPNVEHRNGVSSFRLVRFDQRGNRSFDGWVKVRGVPMNDAHVKAAVNYLRMGPDSSDGAFASRIRRALLLPQFLPAFSVGLIGEGGEVWLRDFVLGPTGRSWFVVSAGGLVVGRFTVPVGEQVVSLLPGGVVLTSGEDSAGEPILVRYGVRR